MCSLIINVCPHSFKHGELKAALTIVGIQALAELNQWRGVLSWVLQQYGETTKIPAKIIQMWYEGFLQLPHLTTPQIIT